MSRTLYNPFMGTITFRVDEETEAALRRLREHANGATQSEIIRTAILDADRAAQQEELRRWAQEVMADPDQVAITRGAHREMNSIRAW
jgi:predicted transcriptional regulator